METNKEKLSASQVALNKRLNVKLDASKPSLTDQSYKKASDINNIMKQYQRTGVLDSTRSHLAQYIDNTQVYSLEEAHAKIQDAQNLFMQLPSNVRKLMDNDPTKMEDFIKNPENQDILVKNKLLVQTKKEASQVHTEQEVPLNSPSGDLKQ